MKLVDGAAVWRMKAQDGLPLEFALAFLYDEGMVPTWHALLLAAKRDGVNLPRLARAIIQDTRNIYDEELHAVLREKLVPLAEWATAVKVSLDN